MSNIFELCPTHFSRGAKNFLGGQWGAASKHLILRKWFVTTVLILPTHVLQPRTILYGFSVMIQKQFFRVFQLFDSEVKHFYQNNTWKNWQIIFL